MLPTQMPVPASPAGSPTVDARTVAPELGGDAMVDKLFEAARGISDENEARLIVAVNAIAVVRRRSNRLRVLQDRSRGSG